MDERTDRFRSIKQRLSAVQQNINISLKADKLPADEVCNQFLELSVEFHRLSANEWATETARHINLVKVFIEATRIKNQQLAEETFEKLLDGKVSCHKRFRNKQ